MNPPKTPFLVLPAMCPEPRCGTVLQRHNADPARGVAPHYETCHPGTTPPYVQAES